jgi:ribA/ribD-fused uncharacterized protein
MQYVIPKFEGEYRFLSNFFPATIDINISGEKIRFPTAEHVFQGAKWRYMTEGDPNKYVNAVLSDSDPNHAKKMGRKVKIDAAKWDDARIETMRVVVWEKFKQQPVLKDRLVHTGAALLVEGNTWGDKFWGRVDGQGNNLLGSILMEVRGYYIWKDRK